MTSSITSQTTPIRVRISPIVWIEIPATVAVNRHERRYPRSFAERAYSNLLSFSLMPRGGHFAAAEEPHLVAADIRRLIAAAP